MVGECPWCLVTVEFQVGMLPQQVREEDEGKSMVEQILDCPSCRRHVYQVGKGSLVTGPSPSWRIEEMQGQWPPPGLRERHESVPAAIAADWSEAHKVHGVGAHKATAAMARRAVQGVCIDKGAKKDHLIKQVKQLVDDGRMHPNMGEWADEVRILGNVGAHPGDDGLDVVSADEAADVLWPA
jgi:hypothetical protein